MFKSGFVSVVGSPNAGKSTFLNTVIGRKVSIVTDKVQTTRDMIKGIYNDEDSQIVFLDTPGFHKPQNKLNVYMNQQIDMALMSIDVLVYMVDGRYGLGKKERANIKRLSEMNGIKMIAVVNKIDLIPQVKTERIIKDLEETNLFSDIIAASMTEKFNHLGIVECVKKYLKEDVKFYSESEFTDYTDEFFIEEIIREKILEKTNDEVPHSVGVKVTNMEEEENLLIIEADIYVERNSQKGIIIGRAGQMLKTIGTEARRELKREFNQPIYLDLHVKVLSKWGQKKESLTEVGYEID